MYILRDLMLVLLSPDFTKQELPGTDKQTVGKILIIGLIVDHLTSNRAFKHASVYACM